MFYTLGSLSWSHFFPEGSPDKAMVANFVALGISGLIFLLPYELIFMWVFSDYDEGNEMRFLEERICLPSEYDRLNPATAKKSIKEYMEFIQ